MNKLIIIGNLTRDPVSNTTPSGINVCNFSVAVNRGRNIAESCAKYLRRGSRVCCWGAVTASTYQAQDGSTRVSMELNADGVEFCGSARREDAPGQDELEY